MGDRGEWLAIVVTREKDASAEEGELLYHAKDEDDVWEHIRGDRREIYVTYAGPPLPLGWAAAF